MATEMSRIFYSATTNGFYVEGIHEVMPDDVIEISNEEHRALMGQQTYPGPDGRPIAGDAPPEQPQFSRWMQQP